MDTKGILMHIDTPDEIAMPAKPADATRPGSSPGLVTMPAAGTPATSSSFRAGEAQDAGLLGFMGQVINVTAVFPLSHAAIVMPASVPVADAMRIADEERPHLVLDAEVDHLPGGLMPQIADAPLGPAAHLVPGALQFLPAAGVFGAPALLFGELPELLAALSLEATDPSPCDNHRLAGLSGDCGKMYLTQITCRTNQTRGLLCLWAFDTHVQFKTVLPDQGTGSGFCWQLYRQNERRVALAHRQDHALLLAMDGLGRPLDRVKPLGAPGILHAHLRMFPAKPARGFDICEKDVNDLLNRLSVEREAAPGGLFQFMLSRPRRMSQARRLMRHHAQVPHTGRFLLRLLEAAEERWRQIGQAINTNCFHANEFFLPTQKCGNEPQGKQDERGRFHSVPSRGDGRSPPFCSRKRGVFMQQTFTIRRPLFPAPAGALGGESRLASQPCSPPSYRTHLLRMQYVQAVCENHTGLPSFLTVAEVQLALHGLERYFAPLFARYHLTLCEVRDTLLWAEGAFGSGTLVEDVIQELVTRHALEQLASRQPGGRRNETATHAPHN